MLAMRTQEDMEAQTTSREVLRSRYRHKHHSQAEDIRAVTLMVVMRGFERRRISLM